MRPFFRVFALLAIALPFGCGGGGSDLMPLEVGHSWNYIAKVGFSTYVTPIKVSRQISVAGTKGVELTSNLGASRLAWTGDALVADRLANTQFVPPLPLVYKTGETSEPPWRGRVIFVDKAAPGWADYLAGKALVEATQSQKPDDDLEYNGQKLHSVRSTVHLKTAAHDIELLTWFAPGLGIVKQEQRTDGTLLVSLTLIPK